MKDITVCLNEYCDRKDTCLRYTASLDGDYYSWNSYICDGMREEHYIPNGKYNISGFPTKQIKEILDKHKSEIMTELDNLIDTDYIADLEIYVSYDDFFDGFELTI